MFQKRSPLVNVSSEVLGLSRNISLLHRLGWLIFFFFLTFSKFSFPILNKIRKCLPEQSAVWKIS